VSKSFRSRLLGVLTGFVGAVLIFGCSGEENIPLKKVDSVLDIPKDFQEKRKGFMAHKGSSANMKRDPSGVNK